VPITSRISANNPPTLQAVIFCQRRVVPESNAGSGLELAIEWAQVLADIAGIQEHGGTEIRTDALAEFHRAGVDRGATDWIPVGEKRADGLIAVATDRAAAARIEALVRRQAELAGAHGETCQGAQCQHAPSRCLVESDVVEIEVQRTGTLGDEEPGAGVAE
jgi:hypothetical protein